VKYAQTGYALVALLFLASCSNAPEINTLIPELPTAVQPPADIPVPATPEPTPEPTTVRLWASPALPADLLGAASLVTHLGDLPVEWVDDPALAEVRIEPNPDRPLARWTYALVAPFPTIRDNLSLQDLRSAWAGSGDQPPVFISEQVLSEMVPLLGNDLPKVSSWTERGRQAMPMPSSRSRNLNLGGR